MSREYEKNVLVSTVENEIRKLVFFKKIDIKDKETIKFLIKENFELYPDKNKIKGIQEILDSYDEIYELSYGEVVEEIEKKKKEEEELAVRKNLIEMARNVGNKLPREMINELRKQNSSEREDKTDELKWIPIVKGNMESEITQKLPKKDLRKEQEKKLEIISPKREDKGEEK